MKIFVLENIYSHLGINLVFKNYQYTQVRVLESTKKFIFEFLKTGFRSRHRTRPVIYHNCYPICRNYFQKFEKKFIQFKFSLYQCPFLIINLLFLFKSKVILVLNLNWKKQTKWENSSYLKVINGWKRWPKFIELWFWRYCSLRLNIILYYLIQGPS